MDLWLEGTHSNDEGKKEPGSLLGSYNTKSMERAVMMWCQEQAGRLKEIYKIKGFFIYKNRKFFDNEEASNKIFGKK